MMIITVFTSKDYYKDLFYPWYGHKYMIPLNCLLIFKIFKVLIWQKKKFAIVLKNSLFTNVKIHLNPSSKRKMYILLY